MTQTVFPTFRYRDARAAIDWLKNTLGFEEARVYQGEGGLIEHAELSIAGNLVMLGFLAFKEWPIRRELDYLRGYAAHTGLPGYGGPQGPARPQPT